MKLLQLKSKLLKKFRQQKVWKKVRRMNRPTRTKSISAQFSNNSSKSKRFFIQENWLKAKSSASQTAAFWLISVTNPKESFRLTNLRCRMVKLPLKKAMKLKSSSEAFIRAMLLRNCRTLTQFRVKRGAKSKPHLIAKRRSKASSLIKRKAVCVLIWTESKHFCPVRKLIRARFADSIHTKAKKLKRKSSNSAVVATILFCRARFWPMQSLMSKKPKH